MNTLMNLGIKTTGQHSESAYVPPSSYLMKLSLYGHIKTAEQRTIIQQYGDRYTGRWRVNIF